MNRSVLTMVAVVSAALALAACGGESDEDKITTVIEDTTTASEPEQCSELVTSEFLEQTEFETGEEAVESCEASAGDDDADSVEVSNVQIDGETATAEVAVKGSDFDNQVLELELVKEDDQWKLNQFTDFVKFDRDEFANGLKESFTSDSSLEPDVAECLSNSVDDLSDQQLQNILLESDVSPIEEAAGTCQSLLGGE